MTGHRRVRATVALVCLGGLVLSGCDADRRTAPRPQPSATTSAEARPSATPPSTTKPPTAAEPTPSTATSPAPPVAKNRHFGALSPRERLARYRTKTDRLAPGVGTIARIRGGMDRWFGCTRLLGVDRVGDPHHRWGYQYDEQDGTGVDHRSALAVRGDKRRLPTWNLVRFRRSPECRSRRTNPNGTGAEARLTPDRAGRLTDPLSKGKVRAATRRLLVRLEGLHASLDRSRRAVRRFDNWESCLVWLPVTEYGDRQQGLGFAFRVPDGVRRMTAIDLDRGNWDDPDYQLLAFLGAARPFLGLRCGPGPGEGVDRSAAASRTGAAPAARSAGATDRGTGRSIDDLLDEVAEQVDELGDDVEDLRKDAIDFVYFDQCMYTIGVTSFGAPPQHVGYRFIDQSGRISLRRALAFDITGFQAPQYDVMAFPGEEPPQIECNEDAGGQETDE